MIDLEIKMDHRSILQVSEHAKLADKKAVRFVAESIVIPAMRASVSFVGRTAPVGQLGTRTGRLLSQVKAKYWRGRDGLANGSVKVKGDRAYIARFHEKGTKKHGKHGGPLPARQMFATVGLAIKSTVEGALVREFEANMKALGH